MIREGKKGLSEIYIFDAKHNIYDPIMMSESRKTFLEPLKERDIKERDILTYVEAYFQALDKNKGDSGILEDIAIFNFDGVSTLKRVDLD
jgi:dihydropteroate synthase